MTVMDLGNYGPIGPSNGAKCVWFEKNANKEEVFDVACLELYKEPKAKIGITHLGHGRA